MRWSQAINALELKHTTTLFVLCDHYILSRNGELLMIKYRTIIMVGLWCYNQSGMTELLIMREPHYGRTCFKSVKTLGDQHSQLWNRPWPLASVFSTTKNVEFLRLFLYRTPKVLLSYKYILISNNPKNAEK